MSVSVLIQTCDLYEPFWRGLWHFMERQWDFRIDAPVRMSNEEKKVETPPWCSQILTGRGTFVENLRKTVESIKEEHIFLMLEDFWPIAPMSKTLFDCLYDEFKRSRLDALQVSNFTPYYTVKRTGEKVLGNELLEFQNGSEWIFNFQARFWRRESLLKFLVEPEISERKVGSAITAEIEADKKARECKDFRVRLYHYLWYPLSGVSYRGELTDFGRHLQNIVEIDNYVDKMFSRPVACCSRQECSG